MYLYRRLGDEDVQPEPMELMDAAPPVDEVVQGAMDERAFADAMDFGDEDVPVEQCHYLTQKGVTWCDTTDGLATPLQICEDTTITIGHSFGAMAAREAYLRREAGTSVTTSGATGPNNALCEVRVVVADEYCESMQFVIRFTDQDRRHLLFRSTGGSVLVRDRDDPGRTVVRCQRAQVAREIDGLSEAIIGYSDDEVFAHVGCYSFFNQSNDGAAAIWRRTPTQFVQHHEGDYRQAVNCGSGNPQHYHHSEQAIYRLLFEYPEVVVRAIRTLRSRSSLRGRLRLVALVVDIFTTRSACIRCRTSSAAVLSMNNLFFQRAIGMIPGDLAAVDPTVLTLVRFACAAPFGTCPSREAVSSSSGQRPRTRILHALPTTDAVADVVAADTVCISVPVAANSPSCLALLTTGSASRVLTHVDRAFNNLVRLGLSPDAERKIPALISRQMEDGRQLDAAGQLLLAIRLFDRIPRNDAGFEPIYQQAGLVVPAVLRIELMFELNPGALNNFDLCMLMLRHYSLLFEGHANAPRHFNRAAFDLFDTCLRSIFLSLGSTTLTEDAVARFNSFVRFFGTNKAAIWDEFIRRIRHEIDEAMSEHTASGDNRARNLAIEFGLWDYYLEKSA